MIRNGYQALREGVAIVDLTGRGLIRATGQDRARYLHAMSTNHVLEMTPGELRYLFFLTAQGRILADANLLCGEDSFLIGTEPHTRQLVLDHLNKFIIGDDVILTDETSQWVIFGIEGPTSAHLLDTLGIENAPAPGNWMPWKRGFIAGASSTGAPACRMIVPLGEKQSTFDWLTGIGAFPATAEEARIVRLENARPRYGEDIDDRTLVQETRLMHAVHFTKGCYLGQEIVERVRSRGQVNRMLAQLVLETDTPPPAQTPLTHSGAAAGHITSAAWSPALGKVVALGYVTAAALASKAPLDAGGIAATVTDRAPA